MTYSVDWQSATRLCGSRQVNVGKSAAISDVIILITNFYLLCNPVWPMMRGGVSKQIFFPPDFPSLSLSLKPLFNPVKHSFRCEGNVFYMLMKGMLRGQNVQPDGTEIGINLTLRRTNQSRETLTIPISLSFFFFSNTHFTNCKNIIRVWNFLIVSMIE